MPSSGLFTPSVLSVPTPLSEDMESWTDEQLEEIINVPQGNGNSLVLGDPQVKGKPRRKAYSDNLNDPVGTIFNIGDPLVISPPEAESYLKYFPHLAANPPFVFSSPKTLVGIEVEVENVLYIDPNVMNMFWTMKEDGSLRNHGREFVTPGTIPMSVAEPALNVLFGGLNKDIDFSTRTSIHVHQDMRQLTLMQLVGFLLTYTAVENLLFKFVGNNRRNNIFCVPITEAALLPAMAHITPKKFLWAIDEYWSKYTALNLLPLLTFGSVEFRHMPGTRDVTKLLRWIELISRLKTFAYRNSYEQIVAKIADLNGNSRYRQFVEEVFGDYSEYLDKSNLLMDMEKPVYQVKNSAVMNKFHRRVSEEPQVESHLGTVLMAWMKDLSSEQMTALKDVHKQVGQQYTLKYFYDYLKTKTAFYYVHYPNLSPQFDIILKASQVETTPVKHLSEQTIYQQLLEQSK